MARFNHVFALRTLGLGLVLPLCASPVWAEYTAANPSPQLTPSTPPVQPGNAIKIWDDRVFNLDAGTVGPETRTSIGGNTRYLDNTKEFNTNSADRARAIEVCNPKKSDSDPRAFSDCVGAQLKRSSDGALGAREPRSGSDGLNTPRASGKTLKGISPVPRQPQLMPEMGGGGSAADGEASESDGSESEVSE